MPSRGKAQVRKACRYYGRPNLDSVLEDVAICSDRREHVKLAHPTVFDIIRVPLLRKVRSPEQVVLRVEPQGGNPSRATRLAKQTPKVRLIGRFVAPESLAVALLTGLLAVGAATGAAAQAYPNRPITLVVPFPPGGGNDALARAVAERMSKTLGEQVVVDNRGGAGGTVATRAASKSAPDGYTILLAYTGTLAINPSLYPNVGYDPRKDFAPIGLIGSLTSVLVVHPALPVHSVAQLIAHAKAHPRKINYGFVPGTVGHITTELFASTAAIDTPASPTRGTGRPWPTSSAATSR